MAVTQYYLPVGFVGFWDSSLAGYAILPLLNANITNVRNWSEVPPAEPGFIAVRQQEAIVPVFSASMPFSSSVYAFLNAFLAYANNSQGLQYYAVNGLAVVGPSLLWVQRGGPQFKLVKITYPRLARWSIRSMNKNLLMDFTIYAGVTDVPNNLPAINLLPPENGDGINLYSAIQFPSTQAGIPNEYLLWNPRASTFVAVAFSIGGQSLHVSDAFFLADYHLQPSFAGGTNPSAFSPVINNRTFAQSEPVWYWVQNPMFMLAVELVDAVADDLISSGHTVQNVWAYFIHAPAGIANGIAIHFPVAKVVEGVKRQMSGQAFRRVVYLQAAGTPPRLFVLDNSVPRIPS